MKIFNTDYELCKALRLSYLKQIDLISNGSDDGFKLNVSQAFCSRLENNYIRKVDPIHKKNYCKAVAGAMANRYSRLVDILWVDEPREEVA